MVPPTLQSTRYGFILHELSPTLCLILPLHPYETPHERGSQSVGWAILLRPPQLPPKSMLNHDFITTPTPVPGPVSPSGEPTDPVSSIYEERNTK